MLSSVVSTSTILLLVVASASTCNAGQTKLRKRLPLNNCSGNSDPDCIPFYNDFKRMENFDTLAPHAAISKRKGLVYTGFNVVAPTSTSSNPSAPYISPASPSNAIRAIRSSGANDNVTSVPAISSKGDLLKLKSFAFACGAPTQETQPAQCRLNVSSFDPALVPGGSPQYKNSVVLAYAAKVGGGPAVAMTKVTGDELEKLQLANSYTFVAMAEEEGKGKKMSDASPRLYLDDLEAVYYVSF